MAEIIGTGGPDKVIVQSGDRFQGEGGVEGRRERQLGRCGQGYGLRQTGQGSEHPRLHPQRWQ